MSQDSFLKLVISLSLSQLAGVLGAIFTANSVENWYVFLQKPVLSPPNWVFGPVWVTLYALMGIAVFLIWQKGFENKGVKKAIFVFIFQLILNAFWSIIFFYFHKIGWALVEIILMWTSIVWTMVVFYDVSKKASMLLLPYFLWVSFATYLNFAIWFIN